MPLAPASHHPSTLNLVATLGISYSGLLEHLDQPMPYFELNSLPHGGGHGQPPPRGPASASLIHLPLSGLLFQPQQCGSGGMGHYFQELAKKKHQGTKHLLKMQNQYGSHALCQDMQKPSQDDWGDNPGRDGDHPSHGEEPRPSPFGSARPGFSPCRLNLWLPGETHPGWAGETYQEDGRPPGPTSSGWLVPKPDWARISSKDSPSNTTWSLWSPAAFEEHSLSQGFYMKPLSAAIPWLF